MSDQRVFAVRVAVTTPDALQALALEHGCFTTDEHGARTGSPGQLMDALASGQLQIKEGGP